LGFDDGIISRAELTIILKNMGGCENVDIESSKLWFEVDCNP